MTCLLLKNPDAVFIHLPKNAGTSIRGLWNGKIKSRAFGHIPKEWQHLTSFAIIREPEARFLSAIRMFKFGNPDFDDYYQNPSWPQLTIDMALDILENPAVPFDLSQNERVSNFKHHIIAQTHPYNCLTQANYVFRQETLSQDYEKIQEIFGFSEILTHSRRTNNRADELIPSDAQRQRIHAAFAQDYAELGYQAGQTGFKPPQLVTQTNANIWAAWPAFFSGNVYEPDKYDQALPADDVDLTLFANDKIVGRTRNTWPGRVKDANQHFHRLQYEFVGKPRIAHLLACTIVIIRKSKGAGPGLVLFHRILEEHLDFVCEQLNSRWLTAVCDTLADHGQNAAQKSLGLCGAILSNMVKLSETEKIVFMPNRPWPPKSRVRRESQLFDGVIGFATDKGDLIVNMLERINRAVENDRVSGRVLSEIAIRMLSHNTILRRFSLISGHDPLPVLSPDARQELENLTEKLL